MANNLGTQIPGDWTSYVTTNAIGLEVIPYMLYDTQTFVDNTTTSLDFFTTVPANESLGNLKNAGMLPNPQSFLIQAISIYFPINLETDDQGASAGPMAGAINDIINLVNTGIMRLKIGEKQYGPYPMWRLPASTFVKGFLAAAGGEAAGQVTGYAQLDGPLYALFPNLMLMPLQNFTVTLAWPAGTIDTSANRSIKVLLDGQMARSIQ